ncbi:hypothetical protein BDZ89DRAFT_1021850 [Hymenopellis radicata]|nr:hypothetical protein BDZ89DRAFT_1021850 [Hymenopellis radicata]
MKTAIRVHLGARLVPLMVIIMISLGMFIYPRSVSMTSISGAPLGSTEAAANIDIIAPALYPDQKFGWITKNQEATQALFRCIERGNCAQNQTKVVILAHYHFRTGLQGGYISGEVVWAMSTFRALKNMGYTVLFALDMIAATQFYHIFDNLVKMIITGDDQSFQCLREPTCAISEENPTGIPAWKMFSLSYWTEPSNPLGAKWTLSPEDYEILGHAPNSYLGYSIEAQCQKYPFIPHSQRDSQAYILAKFLKFFLPDSTPWTPDFFDAAANATGMSFVVGARNLPFEPEPDVTLAASIKNVGHIQQDEFYDILSRSVALVGLGNPLLSPTPYDALCLGIPFINPIFEWDENNRNDRSSWRTQHSMLLHLSAPYVYHVFADDRDGFVDAIKSAAANPIESYVLERMKMSSVEYRLGKLLEHDWRAEAAALLEARQAGLAEGPLFTL